VHLRRVAEAVKAGIHAAGGTPFEFHVIAVCDGICQGTEAMRFSLPSRELIANAVELMAEAHRFDALVLIPSCDKVVPGMLLAAARLDIPAIVVTGGPMLPGLYRGRRLTLVEMREYVDRDRAGELSEEELAEIEAAACPSAGSCSMMATANTMAAVTEALGLSLPGCATAHAVSAEKLRIARESGRRILSLLEEEATPHRIATREALENAIMVDLALGGGWALPRMRWTVNRREMTSIIMVMFFISVS